MMGNFVPVFPLISCQDLPLTPPLWPKSWPSCSPMVFMIQDALELDFKQVCRLNAEGGPSEGDSARPLPPWGLTWIGPRGGTVKAGL